MKHNAWLLTMRIYWGLFKMLDISQVLPLCWIFDSKYLTIFFRMSNSFHDNNNISYELIASSYNHFITLKSAFLYCLKQRSEKKKLRWIWIKFYVDLHCIDWTKWNSRNKLQDIFSKLTQKNDLIRVLLAFYSNALFNKPCKWYRILGFGKANRIIWNCKTKRIFLGHIKSVKRE